MFVVWCALCAVLFVVCCVVRCLVDDCCLLRVVCSVPVAGFCSRFDVFDVWLSV